MTASAPMRIMRQTGKSKIRVWRWQERFAALPRDKARPARIPPLEPAVAERAVELTLAEPPGCPKHWDHLNPG